MQRTNEFNLESFAFQFPCMFKKWWGGPKKNASQYRSCLLSLGNHTSTPPRLWEDKCDNRLLIVAMGIEGGREANQLIRIRIFPLPHSCTLSWSDPSEMCDRAWCRCATVPSTKRRTRANPWWRRLWWPRPRVTKRRRSRSTFRRPQKTPKVSDQFIYFPYWRKQSSLSKVDHLKYGRRVLIFLIITSSLSWFNSAAIKYTEMSTQTVGVGNVLSNIDEVFGHSYHIRKHDEPPERHSISNGSKQENGCGFAQEYNYPNSGAVALVSSSTSTRTSQQQRQQQQQMPPSYHSAVTTCPETGSPTRTVPPRTATSNGGPVSQQNNHPQQHLLPERTGHIGNGEHSNSDVVL